MQITDNLFFIIIISIICIISTIETNFAQDNELDQGITALKEGKNQEAIIIFESVLKNNPNNTDALIAIAIAKTNLGSVEDAKKYFEKALEIEPNNVSAINNYGILSLKTSNYEKAITLANRALILDPDNDISLKIKQSSQNAIKINLLNKEGLELTDQTKFQKALLKFEKALEIDQDNLTTLNNLATTYAYLGDENQALDIYEKILSIDPENTFALYNIGIQFVKLGKYDTGITYFEKVLQVEPNNKKASDYIKRLENFHSLKSPYHRQPEEIGAFFQISVWDEKYNLISFTETDKLHSIYFDELKIFIENLENGPIISNGTARDSYFFKETQKIKSSGEDIEIIKIHHVGTYKNQ